MSDWDSRDNVRLIYKNNEPLFVKDQNVGHRVALGFGETWEDYYNWPEVLFLIDLNLIESGWSAVLSIPTENRSEMTDGEKHYLGQKPKVLELVTEINLAIHNQQEFSFQEYMSFWKQFDEHFFANVIPDSYVKREDQRPIIPEDKKQPVPPPVFAGKTPCLIVLLVIVILGIMLFDPSSPLYFKQLSAMPALAFFGLFLLLVVAGLGQIHIR